MHYKNGRPAKNGDRIVLISGSGCCVSVSAGILYDAVPGNDSCNGRIAVPSLNDACANLSQCLHIDDIASATIPDSTPPVPSA